MPSIPCALAWASVILLVALARIAGFVPQPLANTLITVLPLLMVVTVAGRPCHFFQREG